MIYCKDHTAWIMTRTAARITTGIMTGIVTRITTRIIVIGGKPSFIFDDMFNARRT